MRTEFYARGSFRRASQAVAAGLVLAAVAVALSPGAQAAAVGVPLGTAGSFSVLAGAGITNTGPTTVAGDIGSFPTTSITGTSTLTVGGTNHGGDAVTQGAKNDLVNAYNNAAAQAPATPVVGDLGGQTLFGGVYHGVTLGLTGTVTLDGQGSASTVFVFQSDSTLITASASRVLLVNGASACNVFWQVGSSATLGAGSSFAGTILALTDITLTTSARVNGRVLARNGAVTLDSNMISACSGSLIVAPPPPPSPTPSVTPTATPTTSPSTPAPAASPTPSGTAAAPTTTPSATQTVTPSATTTPSATQTVTPSASPMPSATQPVTPSAMPIPRITPTATPTASATTSRPRPGTTAQSSASPSVAAVSSDAAVSPSVPGQVSVIPLGAVHAGDGSSIGAASDRRWQSLALLALAVPFAFGFRLPRRRRG